MYGYLSDYPFTPLVPAVHIINKIFCPNRDSRAEEYRGANSTGPPMFGTVTPSAAQAGQGGIWKGANAQCPCALPLTDTTSKTQRFRIVVENMTNI